MPRTLGVRRDGVLLVVGGGALLAGSWVAASGDIPGWEIHVFRCVNDLPNALRPAVRVPMQLGSLEGSLAVVAVTGLVTRDRRLTLATLVGGQGAYWLSKVVKNAVGRARPAVLLPGVHLHQRVSGLGYLSGHSAVAFALAATLAPSLLAAGQVAVFAVAGLIAFARIYSGAHLPLDTIGGAGLGLVCGVLTRPICRGYTSPRSGS